MSSLLILKVHKVHKNLIMSGPARPTQGVSIKFLAFGFFPPTSRSWDGCCGLLTSKVICSIYLRPGFRISSWRWGGGGCEGGEGGEGGGCGGGGGGKDRNLRVRPKQKQEVLRLHSIVAQHCTQTHISSPTLGTLRFWGQGTGIALNVFSSHESALMEG